MHYQSFFNAFFYSLEAILALLVIIIGILVDVIEIFGPLNVVVADDGFLGVVDDVGQGEEESLAIPFRN